MTIVTRIDRGLDLPISGEPAQAISDGPAVRQVAIVGGDYVGMKPTMTVREGDQVKLGQPLFEDKKTPGVVFASPAGGTVSAINRGEKRKFLSLVIDVGEQEERVGFESFVDDNLAQLDRERVVTQLLASGLWTALRTRPYSRTPRPDSIPHSIFITAIDTNPLAADPAVALKNRSGDFIAGVQVLSVLTDGPTYVLRRAASDVPGEGKCPGVYHAFDGPHPAGLPGTHIHFIDPVNRDKTVWHIGYQDVAAIGRLFLTGELDVDRVVSLAGPLVNEPRLLRTRIGASLSELTSGQIDAETEPRIISGSVLSGRISAPPVDFLGRFHTQVSVLAEGRERELLGWALPGNDKFSIRRVFASAWSGDGDRRFDFTTNTNGGRRAIVPIGMYEQVLPLDIIATPLLKSLAVGDAETAQQLGVLELDEEDLALCTYVCPGKHDFGPMLRESLTRIEQEG